MSKKFTSFALAICIVFSLCCTAFATTIPTTAEPEVTVVNLSKSIAPQTLQEIVDSTGAQLVTDDGTIIPIDSVVTIEDCSVAEFSSLKNVSPEQDAYKVTVSTTASDDKVVSDSGDKNGAEFNVSATLQLIWVDGPGLDNVIKKVSGTLTILKGKVKDATYVEWGNGWQSALNWTTKRIGDKSSFTYYPNQTVACPASLYSVFVEGASVALTLKAYSSVFQ